MPPRGQMLIKPSGSVETVRIGGMQAQFEPCRAVTRSSLRSHYSARPIGALVWDPWLCQAQVGRANGALEPTVSASSESNAALLLNPSAAPATCPIQVEGCAFSHLTFSPSPLNVTRCPGRRMAARECR